MQVTKLAVTTWFPAFYLIRLAKTGISSLALMRQLGVNCQTAWLIHNKIMESIYESEKIYLLRGKAQIDDACLGEKVMVAEQVKDQKTRYRSWRRSRSMKPVIAVTTN